jgi:hypothetical protein
MQRADPTALILTETDWNGEATATDAWEICVDLSQFEARPGDRIRLNLFGAQYLSWHSGENQQGIQVDQPDAWISTSIQLGDPSRVTLIAKAQRPPMIACIIHVQVNNYGAKRPFLPNCGLQPKPPETQTVEKHILSSTAELLEMAQTFDTFLVDIAARTMLTNNSPEVANIMLSLLAHAARNRTPDGLLDLMTHFGSGKAHH